MKSSFISSYSSPTQPFYLDDTQNSQILLSPANIL